MLQLIPLEMESEIFVVVVVVKYLDRHFYQHFFVQGVADKLKPSFLKGLVISDLIKP